MGHSEETKNKIKQGQNKPEVVEAKRRWAAKFWKEVEEGKRVRKKPTGRPPTSVEKRFFQKISKEKKTDCWLWTSTHGGSLYGMLSVPDGYPEYLAHRISWYLHFGVIPEGMLVLHKCDTPKCVNPEHLFLGTSQDNMSDMVRKNRSLKGEKSPNSKLTEKQVNQIIRLYSTGKFSQQSIADRFGVCQGTVSQIVRNVSWSHLTK